MQSLPGSPAEVASSHENSGAKPPRSPASKRRICYCSGFLASAFGILLFLPVLIALIPGVGNRQGFLAQAGPVVRVVCAIGGPVITTIGFALMTHGSPGLGEAIAPEVDEMLGIQSEDDSEVGPNNRPNSSNISTADERSVRIMIRCRGCRTLNPEEQTTCRECGAEV